MPQEISLKRGKQENNSLALFTDISQESPVIRNAVAQSMTFSSLLFLTPLFFLFGLFHTQSPLRCFVSPSVLCCLLPCIQVEVMCQQEHGETLENDSTHDITTLLCQVFLRSHLHSSFFFKRMSLPWKDQINCRGMFPCSSPCYGVPLIMMMVIFLMMIMMVMMMGAEMWSACCHDSWLCSAVGHPSVENRS